MEVFEITFQNSFLYGLYFISITQKCLIWMLLQIKITKMMAKNSDAEC